MDSFVVSARKYRPGSFDMVVGQQSITATLKNAIRNNQLAQAFLFTGPRGVGKTTCARILAKTINCENISENIEACNACESCLSFNRSHSFNVHELDAASNNTVDGIRHLVEQVRIPPQVGKYKIYIIDEVHMLSQQAFNAFLKTLEEPPAYTKFILATTEKHKIIPTILSRCQIFDFARITIADIIQQLSYVAKREGIEADPNALHIIAQKADGAMRDALSIFDQLASFSGNSITYSQVIESLNVLDYDYYFRVVDLVLHAETTEILLLVNEILLKGFDTSDFITGFGEHLRNLLVSKAPETLKLVEVSEDIRERYLKQMTICPEEFLLQALELVSRADIQHKTSSNKRLLLELTLLQIVALVKKKSHNLAKESQPKLPDPGSHKPVMPQVKAESPSQTSQPSSQEQVVPDAKRESPSQPSQPSSQDPVIPDAITDSLSQPPQPSSQEQVVPDARMESPSQTSQPSSQEPLVPDVEIESKPGPDASETLTDDASPKEVITSKLQALTEEKPSPPKQLRGTIPGSLSLKINRPEADAEDDDDEEEYPEDLPADTISLERFIEVWNNLAEKQKGDSHGLYLAMTKYEPLLNNDGKIIVFLDNAIQEDIVNEHKLELLSYLRKDLNNYSIQIETRIKVNGFRQKAYLPKEKLEVLIEKNPLVAKLKKDLDLELDY